MTQKKNQSVDTMPVADEGEGEYTVIRGRFREMLLHIDYTKGLTPAFLDVGKIWRSMEAPTPKRK